MEFIQGAGTYSNVMKQVNSKKKAVEKLDLEQEEEETKFAGLKEDAELPLKLESGGKLDQPPIAIKNAGFGCAVRSFYSRPASPMTSGGSVLLVCVRTRVCVRGLPCLLSQPLVSSVRRGCTPPPTHTP